MITALVLGGLLLLVFLGSFGTVFLNVTERGRQTGVVLEEVIVEENGALDKIAIIDVKGVISAQPWDARDPAGRNMVDLIEDQLKTAADDDNVKAVVLDVDSPGGEVLASDDIYRALTDFQLEAKKPVVVAMGGMAASGGYYVAAPCRWIVANELTITGSIGVILQTFNVRGLMDKVGVVPYVFKSGKFKDMLSWSKAVEEIDPEAMQMVQEIVDETHGRFKEVVRVGRTRAATLNQGAGRELVSGWEEYADGRILTGKKAYDLGFVDELGNFEDAVQRAKTIAGVTDANLIRYQEPFDFLRMFSLFGESETGTTTIKMDFGVNIPELRPGHPYFLSTSVIQ